MLRTEQLVHLENEGSNFPERRQQNPKLHLEEDTEAT